MSDKNSGFDLSDLEKEIDSAVDNLLIAKEEQVGHANRVSNQNQSKKTAATIQGVDKSENLLSTPVIQPQDQSHKVPSTIAPSLNKTEKPSSFPFTQQQALSQSVPPSQRTDRVETTVLPVHPQISSKYMSELREKLDEVEAQLLTLEWDLNTRNINKAITYLQDLTRNSKLENELAQVVTLIQKVLYQLILDETKLTPTSLKFLQKSWKAVKGMTDERFYLEIDKKALANELLSEFQKLKIDQEIKGKSERIDGQESFAKVMAQDEAIEGEKAKTDTYLYREIDDFMNRLEKLAGVVNEERRKWKDIHQEIINFKNDFQKKFELKEQINKMQHEKSTEEAEHGIDRAQNIEYQSLEKKSALVVSLIKISGVIFGLPEKQIVRSFPIKKWVSDFCIAKGKVKLKDREIPLFNLYQVFKLKPSLEENPLVLLIKGKANHPAAVIIDQIISNEEIAYESITGKPYIFGQAISQGVKVWLLDAEQISP
jgi:hypothetical protein